MKKVLNHIVAFIAATILLFIKKSCKIIDRNSDYKQTIDKNKPVIYFLWHKSGTAIMPYIIDYKKNHTTFVTLSNNKSTAIQRIAFKIFGAKSIDGSKHKGYLASIKGIISAIQSHKNTLIAVTPDGPRGPDLTISDDALFKIIKKFNVQLRYIGIMSSSIVEFNTWDKLYIIKPFSKIIFTDKQLLSTDEISSLDESNLRSIAQERMRSYFGEMRQKFNLPNVEPGAIKKKRPNSGDDRI